MYLFIKPLKMKLYLQINLALVQYIAFCVPIQVLNPTEASSEIKHRIRNFVCTNQSLFTLINIHLEI